MNSTNDFDKMIGQMKDQTQLIQLNRKERNKKYNDYMNMYKEFLTKQTEQIESTDAQNTKNKELISKVFENTFSRILASSDVTIRKIKQTYNQKKTFWDNVIKMNANVSDIELKKEFYLQKHNAEDNYQQAITRQKDKHKSYHLLMNKVEKKEHLRDYQLNNKQFEEKVIQGTNTIQQWKNITNYNNKYSVPQPYSEIGGTVINKFLVNSPKNTNYDYRRPNNKGLQSQNNTFLNNFTKKF